jgi:hypothetical protein
MYVVKAKWTKLKLRLMWDLTFQNDQILVGKVRYLTP